MSSGKKPVGKLRTLAMRNMPLMLTCRELEDFILDYLDGVLPEPQRRKFDWHLRLCADCKRYLESYKQTIAATGATLCEDDELVPECMPEDLVKAILAAREKDT